MRAAGIARSPGTNPGVARLWRHLILGALEKSATEMTLTHWSGHTEEDSRARPEHHGEVRAQERLRLRLQRVEMKRAFVIAAWTTAAAVAYGTVAPVEVPYAIYFKLAPWLGHPSIHKFAAIEHLIVFALLGALITFAWPNRIIIVCCIIIFSTLLLECLQTLTPDRHGTIVDACEKIGGGLLGVFAAHATTRWRGRHKAH